MNHAFLELLYQIRQDYLSNGQNAEIIKSFQAIHSAICLQEPRSEYRENKLKLLDMQIHDLETRYQQLLQQQEIKWCSSRINIGAKNTLDDSHDPYISSMSATPPGGDIEASFYENDDNFFRFIDSVKNTLDEKQKEKEAFIERYSIPDVMKKSFDEFLNMIQDLPDIKNTEYSVCHYVMRKFVLKIRADGDEVFYGTTFGVQLRTLGNCRKVQ